MDVSSACETQRGNHQGNKVPTCRVCNEKKPFIEMRAGVCQSCRAGIPSDESERRDEERRTAARLEKQIASIPLTTEMVATFPVSDQLGIVSGDCVLGMNMLKDIPIVLRDIAGGRSKTLQDALKDARQTALQDMRREAHALGADAVVAVQISHQQIVAGSAMLMVVATGTAVKRSSQ